MESTIMGLATAMVFLTVAGAALVAWRMSDAAFRSDARLYLFVNPVRSAVGVIGMVVFSTGALVIGLAPLGQGRPWGWFALASALVPVPFVAMQIRIARDPAPDPDPGPDPDSSDRR